MTKKRFYPRYNQADSCIHHRSEQTSWFRGSSGCRACCRTEGLPSRPWACSKEGTDTSSPFSWARTRTRSRLWNSCAERPDLSTFMVRKLGEKCYTDLSTRETIILCKFGKLRLGSGKWGFSCLNGGSKWLLFFATCKHSLFKYPVMKSALLLG